MLFHSFPFFVFFTLVFIIYWRLSQHRARMAWLLFASCFFYMSWNPWLITLIIFSASVDYVVALRLESVRSFAVRRSLLVLSILTNLGLLAFFKYMNFFLASAYSAFDILGVSRSQHFLNIILPLGISFYTFETISYVVDVYLGRLRPVRSPLDYALYIMFFPHLIAGPIVRPRDFLPQLKCVKRFNWDRLQLGMQFFLIGLFKKAVIADQLATVVDPVFAEPARFASSSLWLAVIGYSLQIYCDFSGYSDMAIGTAHMLGFKLPMNFNMPYFAANISEFWQRWHISLSRWLRDYLYIPLGGNRNGRLATYRNLLVTMLLGGLWHGASWTFVAWGLYHGLLLAGHRFYSEWRASPSRRPGRRLGSDVLQPLYIAVTFLSVSLGWIFFRAQSFADVTVILSRLAWPTEGRLLDDPSITLTLACLALVFACHLLCSFVDFKKMERRLPAAALGIGLGCLLLLAQVLMPVDAKAFIYFQF